MTTQVTNDRQILSNRYVSPWVQFCLLIVPVVMNGFYLVYALTGWILEGRDKFNWSLEAINVAIWVFIGITTYSVVVMLLAWIRGAGDRHPLMISGWAHIALAFLLTTSVIVCVKM